MLPLLAQRLLPPLLVLSRPHERRLLLLSLLPSLQLLVRRPSRLAPLLSRNPGILGPCLPLPGACVLHYGC